MSPATETGAVSYTVTGVEPVTGYGKLVGLAIARIEIAGISIIVQGIRILRRPDGGLEVRAPAFRRPTGAWASAIILPPALQDALGAEVLAVAGSVLAGDPRARGAA